MNKTEKFRKSLKELRQIGQGGSGFQKDERPEPRNQYRSNSQNGRRDLSNNNGYRKRNQNKYSLSILPPLLRRQKQKNSSRKSNIQYVQELSSDNQRRRRAAKDKTSD